MKHYYGMKCRSVATGAQPKGMIDWSEGTGRYYKELDDYELEEVDMPSSEAHKRAVAKYNAKTFTMIQFRVKNESVEEIREAISASGESQNEFIIKAIYERIEKLKLNKEEQK